MASQAFQALLNPSPEQFGAGLSSAVPYSSGAYVNSGGGVSGGGGGNILPQRQTRTGNVAVSPNQQIPQQQQQQQAPAPNRGVSGVAVPFTPGNPFKNPDGSDTELGMLQKMDRNPIQDSRFKQLMFQWQQSHQPPPQPPAPVLPTPTPTPAPAVMKTPRPVGSTTEPSALSQTPQAGGKAFPALSQIGEQLGSFLQNTKAAPIEKAFISALQSALSAAPGAVQQAMQSPEAAKLISTIFPQIGEAQSLASQAQQARPGSWELLGQRLPELGATEGLQNFVGKPVSAFGTGAGGSALRDIFSSTTGIPGQLAGGAAAKGLLGPLGQIMQQTMGQAGRSIGAGARAEFGPTNRQFQTISPETGKVTPTAKGLTSATTRNVLGSVQDPKQQTNLINLALQGQANMNDVVAGIAGEQGLNTIVKMMTQAQRAGDMGTVATLAQMHQGVQQQIQFNTVLQQAIMAIASGLGSPQAADITAARAPMVSQAAGAQLETPLAQLMAPTLPQGTGLGPEVSYLPPSLMADQQQTQQNRPLISGLPPTPAGFGGQAQPVAQQGMSSGVPFFPG